MTDSSSSGNRFGQLTQLRLVAKRWEESFRVRQDRLLEDSSRRLAIEIMGLQSHDSNIEIRCDMRFWRPTVGDSFSVIMLARALVIAGFTVDLVFSALRGLRRDWDDPGVYSFQALAEELAQAADRYIPVGEDVGGFKFQVEASRTVLVDFRNVIRFRLRAISKKIPHLETLQGFVLRELSYLIGRLREKCHNELSPRFCLRIRENANRLVLFPRLDIQRLSPRLLEELASQDSRFNPNSFLLSSQTDMIPLSQVKGGYYLTWHVRFNAYSAARNLTDDEILASFKRVASLDRQAPIVALSSSKGIERLQNVVLSSKLPSNLKSRLLPQPLEGFNGAASLVLGSKFHFQELGGGIGMIAHYSRIPYFQTYLDPGSIPFPKGSRQFVWNSECQVTRLISSRDELNLQFRLWQKHLKNC